MNLVCPFCAARFRALVDDPIPQAVRLECPSCHRQMVLRPSAPQPARAARSAQAATPAPQRRAAIADEPRPFRNFLKQELEKLGFETHLFDTGDRALDFVRSNGADLVVANVSLKGKMGLELAEEIKGDSRFAETRVALTGPLFRANRFRNDPAALHGADDYIEEQIPARELEQRVRKMFGQAPQRVAEPADEEARRLARLILSDIIIRHPDRVEQGLRSGRFFDELKKEIDEGRAYYEAHVPLRVRQNSEHYVETIQDFVQMKQEEL